jgi:hypothetical protein
MRIDIMTDIETLGTKSNSTVFQVSAIAFDVTNGNILSEFNEIINIECEDIIADGSTIKWWLKTDKELFNRLLNGQGKSGREVFELFNQWILSKSDNPRDVYLWGCGILFDNNMIKTQMSKYGIKYPIFYRNDRDVRTLLELASMKSGYTENEIKDMVRDDKEVKHDALDDCRFQIRVACRCWEILMRERG